MRRTVRIAAGVVAAVAVVAFAASCDDDDVTGAGLPTYSATLTAAAEFPAGSSTATGSGTATFVDHGTFFEYTISVTGLTGVIASHIHAPATTSQNANVIINLFNPIGASGAVNGVLATGTVSDANNPNFSVATLRGLFDAGTAYVNVHTSQFTGGAIRGQLARSN